MDKKPDDATAASKVVGVMVLEECVGCNGTGEINGILHYKCQHSGRIVNFMFLDDFMELVEDQLKQLVEGEKP